MSSPSFGTRALATPTASAWLQLERDEGRAELFDAIDVVVAGLALRALHGEQRVVEIAREGSRHRVALVGVPDELRSVMAEAFQLEAQQARGAWFLPETASIDATMVTYAFSLRHHGRYAHTLAAQERAKLPLSGNPDAMVVWAVLQPLFEQLLAPVRLRVDEGGKLERAEFVERWSAYERFLADLRLDVAAALAPFRWGGGWSRLDAERQVTAKMALITTLGATVDVEVLRRHRARATRVLVTQYYAKAKKGRAKRRQVLTKELSRALAAFFGGDWLAFVRYLGEEPHDEEHVATALPEAKLVVGGRERAAELAAKKGLPVEEVERMLGAFWDVAGRDSPIHLRADALRQYWSEFDRVHAAQAPGMVSLWGFVEEGAAPIEPSWSTPYQPRLYEKLLAPELLAVITRCWGTTTLARWPDRVVTEPFPHVAMTDALGPALRFWHGCALTAWFICEGPSSRTDLPGLERYYADVLVELAELGAPIDRTLFAELLRVPLGPEEPIIERRSTSTGVGLTFETQMTHGARRRGFERLRDVVTSHRRAWTHAYFERYLRARWEQTLKAARRQFDIITEDRGKAPTLKQFAKHAVPPARLWFGGDVGLLYAALGLKQSFTVERRSLLPRDSRGFAEAVFRALGGKHVDHTRPVSAPEEVQRRNEEWDRERKLLRLAADAIEFVQVQEAIGREPTSKEAGGSLASMSSAISADAEAAWSTFSSIIRELLRAPRAPER